MEHEKSNLLRCVVISLVLGLSLQEIYIEQPQELRNSIYSFGNKKGYLEYSVSTFGYLDYQMGSSMLVIPLTGTQEGCLMSDFDVVGKHAFLTPR